MSIDRFMEYGEIVAANILAAYVSATNLFVGWYLVMCRHLPHVGWDNLFTFSFYLHLCLMNDKGVFPPPGILRCNTLLEACCVECGGNVKVKGYCDY